MILLRDYNEQVSPTDRFGKDDILPLALGLFGEVGSVMAATKKHFREKEVFVRYQSAVEEEFGDVLWYFAAVCRRFDLALDTLFSPLVNAEQSEFQIAAGGTRSGQIGNMLSNPSSLDMHTALAALGEAASDVLVLCKQGGEAEVVLSKFCKRYIDALDCAGVSFEDAARGNIVKVRGRFLEPIYDELPNFDDEFPDDERLPTEFEIHIVQKRNGRSYLKWNDVFIGDPLSDNIADRDGFRFHDVLHLSHAAILHWSPTFRALIKHKRKSDPQLEEAQDSGRAIVVEEGLTAWIFSRAKELNFFEHQDNLSFDILKTVEQFVTGYEVEACPLRLWETAILEGYGVFREVLNNEGGTIVGDRNARKIWYKG